MRTLKTNFSGIVVIIAATHDYDSLHIFGIGLGVLLAALRRHHHRCTARPTENYPRSASTLRNARNYIRNPPVALDRSVRNMHTCATP